MVWNARLIRLLPLIASAVIAVAAVLVGGALGLALLALAFSGTIAAAERSRRTASGDRAAAAVAAARQREADIVAETAASLLAATAAADAVTPQLERALAGVGARLQMCHAPAPSARESALPVKASGVSGWLYVDRDGPLTRADADRLLGRIGDLMSSAYERERVKAKLAEAEAAAQADLAKTSVMHAIAHDLRAPLATLSTTASALSDQQLAHDERLRLAAALQDETGALERMVEDLLDLSRLDAGAATPTPEWCDLRDLVGAAVERVRAKRDDCNVDVNLPDGLPLVHADRTQLERVFTNLIENAAKFSPSGRAIEIRGICANGRVTIRVLDHGPGIPPAEQGRVFKAFVRGSSPASGSGLGLAICRGFVEANGGRITLQSGARDGSAFAVSFPVAQQPSTVS